MVSFKNSKQDLSQKNKTTKTATKTKQNKRTTIS